MRERFENPADLVFRNTAPCVGYMNGDFDPVTFQRLSGRNHQHIAAIGKLDGIGNQVADTLAHAHRVNRQRGGHARVYKQFQTKAFFIGGRFVQLADTIQLVAQVSLNNADFHAPRFDLGKIKNVIQYGEEGVAGFQNDIHLVCTHRVKIGARQDL